MPELNQNDENFVVVRCHDCGRILFEVSLDATGTIRKKCQYNKCKQMKTISLPIPRKNTNLPRVGA